MSIPLPAANSQEVTLALQNCNNAPFAANVYQAILAVELLVANNQAALILCRVLGYFFIDGPSANVRERIVLYTRMVIANAVFPVPAAFAQPPLAQAYQVIQLSRLVFRNLISIWHSVASAAVDLPGQYAVTANFNIFNSPQVSSGRKKEVLARDGNKCVASGDFNTSHYRANPNPNVTLNNSAILQIAHIIPRKLNGANNDSNTIWGTFVAFGFVDNNFIAQNFSNVNGLNAIDNLMSLGSDRHGQFDRMLLWLEHFNNHTYQVCFGPTYLAAGTVYPQVNLANQAAQNYLEPRREFLIMHATACRIGWMAGASDVLLRGEDDPDDGDLRAVVEDLTTGPTEARMKLLAEQMKLKLSQRVVIDVGERVEPGDIPHPRPVPVKSH